MKLINKFQKEASGNMLKLLLNRQGGKFIDSKSKFTLFFNHSERVMLAVPNVNGSFGPGQDVIDLPTTDDLNKVNHLDLYHYSYLYNGRHEYGGYTFYLPKPIKVIKKAQSKSD